MVPCRHESKLIYWMFSINSTNKGEPVLQFVRVTKPIIQHLELPLFISSKPLLQLLGSNHLNFKRGGGGWKMFPGLDIIFLSRRGPVFLLVLQYVNRINSVLDIFFRPNWDPVFFFLFKKSYSPPPPASPLTKIKIKWSFPYAGDSLCNRSASRTKHAVWISSLVDILLLCNIKAVFEIQC